MTCLDPDFGAYGHDLYVVRSVHPRNPYRVIVRTRCRNCGEVISETTEPAPMD